MFRFVCIEFRPLFTVYVLWPELRTFPNTFLVVYWDNEVRKCTYSFVARSVYIIQTLPKHNEYLLWEKDGIPITYLKNSITNTTYWVLNSWTQGNLKPCGQWYQIKPKHCWALTTQLDKDVIHIIYLTMTVTLIIKRWICMYGYFLWLFELN